jgi:hypothetical protein
VVDAVHLEEVVAERPIGGRRHEHHRVADAGVEASGSFVAEDDVMRAGAGGRRRW